MIISLRLRKTRSKYPDNCNNSIIPFLGYEPALLCSEIRNLAVAGGNGIFIQKCIKQQQKCTYINFTAYTLFIVIFVELLCRELKHCLTGKHIILYLLMTLLYRNIKQQLSCSSINIIYLNYKRWNSRPVGKSTPPFAASS